jgi:serine/threonine-protein kinase HipA
MKTDRQAVVWTRQGVRPLKMGTLYLTESECRFTYDSAYLDTGLPGLGVIYAPEVFGASTIVRPRTEYFDFLPPVQSLVPPRSNRNFQRKLILDYLAKNHIHPKPGIEADWEILKVSGHGGIGHLDVFESDEKAMDWYSAPSKTALFSISESADFSLKQYLTWFDQDAEALMQIIGPTPSVGGAIPKLLVSIPESGWDGRVGLPSRYGDNGVMDVVLKFEQSNIYPGMLELESLALDIHQEAGFIVPDSWQVEFNGVPALAVKRFDRDASRHTRFIESLYSILASGDRSVTGNNSYTYDRIGRAIDRSPIDIVSDREAGKQYLFSRLVLALLTGNGDLHMENLSVIRTENTLAFTPVYDPAPMRAYSIHNMLAVMPFGNYGELNEDDSAVSLREALNNLAHNLGIKKHDSESVIERMLRVTENLAERIQALRRLPPDNKNNLVEIVSRVRRQLE